MERKFEILITQICSLLEMYKIDLHNETEKPESSTSPTPPTPSNICSQKFDKERLQNLTNKIWLDKLNEMKYSTKYYHENKKRIPCKFCNKQINSLAKTSHYKSKKCINNREEPRILTSRIE